MITLYILFYIAQYYICWATYRNWFKSNITYCKIENSFTFPVMVYLLPIGNIVPILPIFLVGDLDLKWFTYKWVKF